MKRVLSIRCDSQLDFNEPRCIGLDGNETELSFYPEVLATFVEQFALWLKILAIDPSMTPILCIAFVDNCAFAALFVFHCICA